MKRYTSSCCLHVPYQKVVEIRDLYLQGKGRLGAPKMDLALGTGRYNGARPGPVRLGEALHLDLLGATGTVHPARGSAAYGVFPGPRHLPTGAP